MVNRLGLTYALVSLILGVLGSREGPDCPRHRGLPDDFVRAENRVQGRDRALYRLDLRNAINGYVPDMEYRFRVHTTARKLKFNDATIMIDALDQSCGSGRWVLDSGDLYSPMGCPSVVTTEQKEPMGRAHFKWQAPPCGCVHIRVRVHANSTYFIEDESVHNGPLARTICPQARYTKEPEIEQSTEPSLTLPELLSREDRLELLCEIIESHEPEDVLKNEDFKLKRTMSTLNSFELERLHIAVEQRHNDLRECCDIESAKDRSECLGDVRRIRIDRFCGSGEPDIPLTKTRYDWIKQKQPECCPQIGEARYTCFNYSLSGDAMLGDEGERQSRVDMDDFDPVNYMEDYPEAAEIREKFSARHATKPKVSKAENGISKNEKVQYQTSVSETEALTRHSSTRHSKTIHEEDSRENNEVSGEAKDVGEENQAEEETDDVDVDVNKGADRVLSLEECCMNGIDAGTRVFAQGFEGCFKKADQFNEFFSQWNRKCDRHFVVCCMRVVDGDIDIEDTPKAVEIKSFHKCRNACKVCGTTESVNVDNVLKMSEISNEYRSNKMKTLLTKLDKVKSENNIFKFPNNRFGHFNRGSVVSATSNTDFKRIHKKDHREIKDFRKMKKEKIRRKLLRKNAENHVSKHIPRSRS